MVLLEATLTYSYEEKYNDYKLGFYFIFDLHHLQRNPYSDHRLCLSKKNGGNVWKGIGKFKRSY